MFDSAHTTTVPHHNEDILPAQTAQCPWHTTPPQHLQMPQNSSENWNTTLRANYLLILMLNYTNPVHFLGIYSLLLLQSAPVTAKHFMICCMRIWSYIIHPCVATPTNNLDKEKFQLRSNLVNWLHYIISNEPVKFGKVKSVVSFSGQNAQNKVPMLSDWYSQQQHGQKEIEW